MFAGRLWSYCMVVGQWIDLDNVPDVFGGVAEFTACYTSAETVVAD